MKKVELTRCHWLNEPKYSIVKDYELILETDPYTDLWSKTVNGVVSHNAPILYYPSVEDGTVTVRCQFKFNKLLDQCGLVVYITDDCWFKACVEYNNEIASHVSTVVTMNGYSDLSSTNISSEINQTYFRLHRRGFDFKIEYSFDGVHYKQMRIFHLDPLGQQLKIGLFACSPYDSSFDATFTDFTYDECQWK